MARRTSTAWLVMEKPATRASPEEGAKSVVSILIVVVLPAPLEPSKPKTSPALTERVRASTAVNAPKRRVRALISRTMSPIRRPTRPGTAPRSSARSVYDGSLFGNVAIKSAKSTHPKSSCWCRKEAGASQNSGPAPVIAKLAALLTTMDEPLFRNAECNVNARIHRVAQVVHAVNLDHKNVLRVQPVAWPQIYKFEPIAAVLEAMIPAVIGLTDAKPVFLSKLGLVPIFGNAATTGMLRRLFGPGLQCVFLFLLTVLVLLLHVLLFLLGILFFLLRVFLLLIRILVLLRALFPLLCRLRLFLVLGRFGFLFLLLVVLVVLLLLCVCRGSDSKSHGQNCCADHSY